jgi:hypothetical protein
VGSQARGRPRTPADRNLISVSRLTLLKPWELKPWDLKPWDLKPWDLKPWDA